MQSIRDMFVITRARTRIRAAICSAIKSRRVIEFYYQGGFRTAEPFCLGVVMAGEADNESFLCYQTGGHSEYGNLVGWKLFRSSEISDLDITGERFSVNRPGYDPENPEMTTIYCCVSGGEVAEVKRQKSMEKVPKIEREIPSYEETEKPKVLLLTHNELMRRFRFSHPIPLPELYTNIFA